MKGNHLRSIDGRGIVVTSNNGGCRTLPKAIGKINDQEIEGTRTKRWCATEVALSNYRRLGERPRLRDIIIYYYGTNI